jgi:tRNA (guanine37-N1)-methyltransferase
VEYRGWRVPDVLLSGDHQKIEDWRTIQAIERTYKKRPDMILKFNPEELSKKPRAFLNDLLKKIPNKS